MIQRQGAAIGELRERIEKLEKGETQQQEGETTTDMTAELTSALKRHTKEVVQKERLITEASIHRQVQEGIERRMKEHGIEERLCELKGEISAMVSRKLQEMEQTILERVENKIHESVVTMEPRVECPIVISGGTTQAKRAKSTIKV